MTLRRAPEIEKRLGVFRTLDNALSGNTCFFGVGSWLMQCTLRKGRLQSGDENRHISKVAKVYHGHKRTITKAVGNAKHF